MAAEIIITDPAGNEYSWASMRPRRMAAEILLCRAVSRSSAACFNEAAANGRGNRRLRAAPHARPRTASMRPRRMAAEIRAAPADPAPADAASMRPRRMAAEIAPGADTARVQFGHASMRPRRMAAEIADKDAS